MTLRSTFALAAVLALASPALAASRPTDAQRLDKLLAGRVAGKPVDCISLGPISSGSSNFEGAIVYNNGGTLYLNRFDGSCPLHRDDAIVTRTPGTRLCRGDIAQILDPALRIERGSCALGSFTPYAKVK